MKEKYFTPENIDETAGKMINDLGRFRGGRGITFSPRGAALLILDMQNCFLEESSHAWVPGMEAIIPGIARLASAFAGSERPVLMTRHLNTEKDAGMMGRWWSDLIRARDDSSRITEQLSVPGALLIVKTQYDAFFGTSLEDDLRKAGIGQLVITGVMTHLCVSTTARSAFVRGFEVFIPVDAVAAYNEELHMGALRGLAHGVAAMVTVEEITGMAEEW